MVGLLSMIFSAYLPQDTGISHIAMLVFQYSSNFICQKFYNSLLKSVEIEFVTPLSLFSGSLLVRMAVT